MLQKLFTALLVGLLISATMLIGCGDDDDDDSYFEDAVIFGNVTDAQGEAVAGANVKIHFSADRSVTTDQNGRYRFEDIPNEQYQITVSKAGYSTYIDTIMITGNPVQIDVVLQDGIPYSIAGVITDELTLLPIANATVQTDPMTDSPLTDAAGVYHFDGLEPGTYTVRVFALGYESETISIVVERDETARADFMLTSAVVVLSVSPDALEFGDATSKILVLENKGNGTLTWEISFPSEGWLSVVPMQGNIKNIPTTVNVTVNRQGLEPGNYDLILIVTSNGGIKQIPVTMDVL